ncbi:hypothetical protein DIPPA_03490 [Diplonema papillatum]|nr:hypothetical protein DIPPA_03490 [Diplonema papillatum]
MKVAGQSQEIPAAAEYVKKSAVAPGREGNVLVTKSDLPNCMLLREVEKELGLASLAKDRPYAVASCAIKGFQSIITAARGLNELAILMDRDPRISPIPAPAKKKEPVQSAVIEGRPSTTTTPAPISGAACIRRVSCCARIALMSDAELSR